MAEPGRCPWPKCGEPVVELHESGLHVVLCNRHWRVLVDYIKTQGRAHEQADEA